MSAAADRNMQVPPDGLVPFYHELAKALLVETDLNITEISRRVGYENFRTMNSIFKKVEGITGTQFRENSRKIRPL